MDLYEYQARDLFEAHGVPVLRGIIATTPEEARSAAEQIATLRSSLVSWARSTTPMPPRPSSRRSL